MKRLTVKANGYRLEVVKVGGRLAYRYGITAPNAVLMHGHRSDWAGAYRDGMAALWTYATEVDAVRYPEGRPL